MSFVYYVRFAGSKLQIWIFFFLEIVLRNLFQSLAKFVWKFREVPIAGFTRMVLLHFFIHILLLCVHYSSITRRQRDLIRSFHSTSHSRAARYTFWSIHSNPQANMEARLFRRIGTVYVVICSSILAIAAIVYFRKLTARYEEICVNSCEHGKCPYICDSCCVEILRRSCLHFHDRSVRGSNEVCTIHSLLCLLNWT